MKKNQKYIANPPGATIKEQIEMLGMNQKELAARMGMSEKHISKLINGDVQLTVDVAVRLEMILGLPAQFWCNLESIYREKLLKIQEEVSMDAEIEIARKVPYAEMVSNGWIAESVKWTERVIHLRRYFEIAQLNFLRSPLIPEIACRKKEPDAFNNYTLLVWAQKAKIEAREIVTQPINLETLRSLLPQLKEMASKQGEQTKESLIKLLARSGIALILLPPMNEPLLYGATFYDGKKIVMGVAAGDRLDSDFWFNLYHEIAHVLYDDIGKRFESSEDYEERANQFARDMLQEPCTFV